MGDFFAGFLTALFVVLMLVFSSFILNSRGEENCEREYNVYDCEQDPTWYPVYNPEVDYEEDTP